MFREDYTCDYCEAQYTIESEIEDSIMFCPYCGSDIMCDAYDEDWDYEE